jgi:hypothetical protein
VRPEFSNDVCSSVLYEGHVYGFDLTQLQASANRASRGRFKCLDFSTGQVKWQTDRVGQASVLVADGKLVLLNDTGTLILARASPAGYAELARAKLLQGGICWTPPTLHRGRLYLRNHQHAVCVFVGNAKDLDPERETVTITQPGLEMDLTWLVPHEPDYPHDAPRAHDVALWFWWCALGVFGGAAVVGWAAALAAWILGASRVRMWAMIAFTVSAFLLGLAGTTLFSAWTGTFILTWPASLHVAFRVTLGVITWAESKKEKGRPRIASRLVTLAFLALCFGYYRLCLAVGYVVVWGYLAGFLPAALPAVVAARARRPWLAAAADVAAFAVYFWTSGLLPAYKGMWLE